MRVRRETRCVVVSDVNCGPYNLPTHNLRKNTLEEDLHDSRGVGKDCKDDLRLLRDGRADLLEQRRQPWL